MFQPIQQLPPQTKEFDSLPSEIVNQLTEAQELIGYIKSHDEYRNQFTLIITQIDNNITKVKQLVTLIKQYDTISDEINDLTKQVNDIYNKFVNNEIIQYKLLSTNFDSNFLKQKYTTMMNQDTIHYNGDLETTIKEFKSARKLYHLRREKINRWNEDRVTGFI